MHLFSHLVFYFCEKNVSIEETPDLFYNRVRRLSNIGYHGVELMVRNACAINIKSLGQKLDEYNIKVSAIGSGKIFTQDGLSFSSENEQIRRAATNKIKQHIELSAQIGSPPVIIGSVRGDFNKDTEKGLANIKKCLFDCAEFAKNNNVQLALEPMEKSETVFINTVQEALEMINDINISSLGLTLDNCNMDIEENNIKKAINDAAKYIFHVQVADINRYYPSYSSYSLDLFLEQLYANGYTGFVSVEPCNYICSPIDDAKMGLNWLKNFNPNSGVKK